MGLYFSKFLVDGLIFGGAYVRRDLSTEGNLRFKIDWASLIVGSKFTVFALFYPGGLIFGRVIYQRVFGVTALIGLVLEGLIFGILRYFFL